jgi:hypothetical protein
VSSAGIKSGLLCGYSITFSPASPPAELACRQAGPQPAKTCLTLPAGRQGQSRMEDNLFTSPKQFVHLLFYFTACHFFTGMIFSQEEIRPGRSF